MAFLSKTRQWELRFHRRTGPRLRGDPLLARFLDMIQMFKVLLQSLFGLCRMSLILIAYFLLRT